MAIELLPVSPSGEITHGQAREKINECAASLNTPLKRVIVAFHEDYTDQSPLLEAPALAQDTPITVKFGDGGVNGKFDVGSDGVSTCIVDGNYSHTVTLQMAREAVAGTSWLYARVMKNGSQFLGSVLKKFSTTNNDTPLQFSFSNDYVAGDTVHFEFMIGSEGVNDGLLQSSAPVAVGWSSVPSARLAIDQYENVT